MDEVQDKYTFRIEPKCCQGEDAAYSGSVTMKMLTTFQRTDLMEKFAKAIDLDPGSVLSEAVAKHMDEKTASTVRLGRFLQRNVAPFVLIVDITRKEDGFKLTSFDDILYESPISDRCVSELGYALLRPTRVGNGGSPS